MLAKVKALWLGQDRGGFAAIFECEARSPLRRGAVDAFELAARVFAASGGSGIAPGVDHDDRERVLVVVDPAAGAGYRTRGPVLAIEEQLPDADWTVALAGSPRVLFSKQPLGPREREAIASREDSVAVVGERELVARARAGPVFFYAEEETSYVRQNDVAQPLRADEIRGIRPVKLGVSFASTAMLRPEADEEEPAPAIAEHRPDAADSVLAVGVVGVLLFGLPIAVVAIPIVLLALSGGPQWLVVPFFIAMALAAFFVLRTWLRQPVRARVAPPKRIAAPPPEAEADDEVEEATEERSRR